MRAGGGRALTLLLAGLAALAVRGEAQVGVKQVGYLKASNPDAMDHFGCGGVQQGHTGRGVALSGDGTTLAVGAPHEASGAKGVNGNQRDNSVSEAGAVYVYTRAGSGWTQQAYLKASNPQMSAGFGHYVALSDDGSTLAVSAHWESSAAKGINGNQQDESIPQAGAVYVFTRQGAAWSQQAYVKASNTGEAGTADTFGEGDQFGFSLALSGDGATLAVGALTEDGGTPGINGNQADNAAASAGAVYVFTRAGRAWSQQAYVKSANIDAGDLFGYAVALSRDGSVLAVGAFDEDGSARQVNGAIDNRAGGSGAAYVFTRTGAIWAQQAYIKPSNIEAQDAFGVDVALSDDGTTLLVGSLDEDCAVTGVNAPGCDTDWRDDLSMGAAYVFVRSGGTWSQQAFLKASNTGPNDTFSERLALSGDGNVAVIGASVEDGSSKGINGKNDDAAIDAGAVYLFTRSGTTWRQQAYIKGNDTEAYDQFGGSVSLDRSGRVLVVGAQGDDSGTASNPVDKSVDEAGAVYTFSLTR
jgi:trimeric autotransporter adhesin